MGVTGLWHSPVLEGHGYPRRLSKGSARPAEYIKGARSSSDFDCESHAPQHFYTTALAADEVDRLAGAMTLRTENERCMQSYGMAAGPVTCFATVT